MSEILGRLGNDEIFLLFLITTSAVTALTIFLTSRWENIRRAELDTSLKQDMLNRGFSADQIKVVLETSSPASPPLVNLASALGGQQERQAEPQNPSIGVKTYVRGRIRHALLRVAGRI